MEAIKTHFQITLERLGHYAIPIFTMRKRGMSPYLVGTGVLFRSDTALYLITAAHVIDELKRGLVVTGGRNGFIRFAADKAAFKYRKGIDRDHDICIARIDSSVVEELNEHYQIVERAEVSVVDPYDKLTLYALVGYPHSKNKPRPSSGTEIEIKPYYYVCREFLNISKLDTADKSEKAHVAFNATFKKCKDITLQSHIQPPKPNGISGCGVWKIKLNRVTGQIDRLALVGVGIEYLKYDNAFVATRINSALMAINQFRGIAENVND